MGENLAIAPVARASLLVTAAGDLPTLALRPRDAAKALGIGARKLWELTRDKKIPHFRLGTAILYPVDALKTWLEAQTQASVSAATTPAAGGGQS